MYKFKVPKEPKEEIEGQVEFGTHFFKVGQDHYRIVIKPGRKVPDVDELKVVYEKGLDTKIIYKENEYDVPYRFKRFLVGDGVGEIITQERFQQHLLDAIANITQMNLEK